MNDHVFVTLSAGWLLLLFSVAPALGVVCIGAHLGNTAGRWDLARRLGLIAGFTWLMFFFIHIGLHILNPLLMLAAVSHVAQK